MADYLKELAKKRLDEHVRQEIQDLAKRGNVTLEEYKALRCNSWEWEHLYTSLTDEALIYAIEHNLKNCYPKSSPCATYTDALAAILAPEMLKRWREMTERWKAAVDRAGSFIVQRNTAEADAQDAYARGRREAIEEAAKMLREKCGEPYAWIIERHETSLTTGKSEAGKQERRATITPGLRRQIAQACANLASVNLRPAADALQAALVECEREASRS